MAGYLGDPDDAAVEDEEFFPQEETTHRGLTLSEPDSDNLLGQKPGLKPGLEETREVDLEEFYPNDQLVAKPTVATERFMEGDVPPSAPKSKFFQFEVTTLYTTSDKPFELGNHVLDFLGKEVESQISKVRRTNNKFNVKADVFKQGAACTTKVRFYSCGNEKYAIEFQRHTGDTVAFNDTFKHASEYLKPRVGAAKSEQARVAPQAPAAPPRLSMSSYGVAASGLWQQIMSNGAAA